ncbi:unnamed protein product, partial [Effrenium voratum]
RSVWRRRRETRPAGGTSSMASNEVRLMVLRFISKVLPAVLRVYQQATDLPRWPQRHSSRRDLQEDTTAAEGMELHAM